MISCKRKSKKERFTYEAQRSLQCAVVRPTLNEHQEAIQNKNCVARTGNRPFFWPPGVIVFRSKAPYHGPYADVASFASGYYNALIQKDYDTALGLLHRSPDTMFDDEFLLTGLQNSPPIYYRVNSVKKLSDGIFEVDGDWRIG